MIRKGLVPLLTAAWISTFANAAEPHCPLGEPTDELLAAVIDAENRMIECIDPASRLIESAMNNLRDGAWIVIHTLCSSEISHLALQSSKASCSLFSESENHAREQNLHRSIRLMLKIREGA